MARRATAWPSPICRRSQEASDVIRKLHGKIVPALCLAWLLVGCSHGEKETEPTVTVQVAPAAIKPMQEIVTAEAVLYPLHQAALVPKITAPVRKFLVNRGSKVRAGQLLAVLENRDLAAAATENRG